MENRKAMFLTVAILFLIAMLISLPRVIHAEDVEPVAEEATEAVQTVEPVENAETVETVEAEAKPGETPGFADKAKEFWQEKILPHAISVLFSVAAYGALFAPALKIVKSAVKLWSNQQNSFGKFKEESEEKITELSQQLKDKTEQFEEAVGELKNYKETQARLEKEISNLTSMVSIGFANSAELVRKGAARRICAIAESMQTDAQALGEEVYKAIEGGKDE